MSEPAAAAVAGGGKKEKKEKKEKKDKSEKKDKKKDKKEKKEKKDKKDKDEPFFSIIDVKLVTSWQYVQKKCAICHNDLDGPSIEYELFALIPFIPSTSLSFLTLCVCVCAFCQYDNQRKRA